MKMNFVQRFDELYFFYRKLLEMNKFKRVVFCALVILAIHPAMAQTSTGDPALEEKVASWVAALQLTDNAKSQKVQTAIVTHLSAVKDWHNSHPYTLVPAGINPVNGNNLSEMDRQIITCSTKPKSIHDNLLKVLREELDEAQVEMILDKYTIGKVAFTLAGYKAIVPDLTVTEEVAILKNLKQAREQAIDYKNMKEISAIFEIYKTRCEQYLNNNGRNWRQLYRAYTDKIKAQKAADKNKQ